MIILDGVSLNLEQLHKIARDQEMVGLSSLSKELVQKASLFVEKMVEKGDPVYGINTGFGHLSHVMIDKCQVSLLQENLLKSHACGVGDPLAIDIVRAMMALRINALIKGHSGIRLETIEKLVELLNKNIIPVVFEKGSLGASGDLAMLSHMSLPILGLGEVFYQGERMETQKAFELAGVKPLNHLHAKEGLSLINGTQAMSAVGGLVLYDTIELYKKANLAVSMTMEALGGITAAFDDRVHQVRNQVGQIEAAREIRENLKGSTYTTYQLKTRVQDAYSIRCTPQVHGAIKQTIDHAIAILEREMNAVTDNPILFPDDELAISAGNFHGEPLAFIFDYLALGISELANISERRIERMVNPHLNLGLPAFLSKSSGLNSGFMIVQYTAASLVSENKVLAHPASVDSIPSSANQEDHVSMGFISASKAKKILENSTKVIAMEIMTACQAIDFREKALLGEKTSMLYQYIRSQIPFIESDEVMYPMIHLAEKMIKASDFFKHLEKGEFYGKN